MSEIGEGVASESTLPASTFDAVFAQIGRTAPLQASSIMEAAQSNSPQGTTGSPSKPVVAAKKPSKKLLAPPSPKATASSSSSTTTTVPFPTSQSLNAFGGVNLTPAKLSSVPSLKFFRANQIGSIQSNSNSIGSAGSSNDNSINSNSEMVLSVEKRDGSDSIKHPSSLAPSRTHQGNKTVADDGNDKQTKPAGSDSEGRNKRTSNDASNAASTVHVEPTASSSSSTSSSGFSTFLRSRKKSMENVAKQDDHVGEKSAAKIDAGKSNRKNDGGNYPSSSLSTPDLKIEEVGRIPSATISTLTTTTTATTGANVASSLPSATLSVTTTPSTSFSLSRMKNELSSQASTPASAAIGNAVSSIHNGGETSIPSRPPPLTRRIRLKRNDDDDVERDDGDDDAGILGDVSAEPSFEDSRNTLVHQPISLDDWRQQTSKSRNLANCGDDRRHHHHPEMGASTNEDEVGSPTTVLRLPPDTLGLSSPKLLPTPAFMMSKLLNNANNNSSETTDSEFAAHGDEMTEDMDDDDSDGGDVSQLYEEDFLPIVYAEDPPKSLLCPLCGNVFKTPVIANCGHTFCRHCVEEGVHRICPKDKKSLAVVVENIAVNEQIGDLPVRCRYGLKRIEDGGQIDYIVDSSRCPATFRASSRDVHELNCDFAPIQCPNNEGCGLVPRSRLQDHLRTCRQTQKCKHHLYGCTFIGNSKAVKSHSASSCRYEGIKEFLHISEERTAELRRALTQKDQEISFLRSMLSRVSEKLENLETRFEEKNHSLEAKEETREKSILDLKNENFKLCEEISILNTRVNEVVLGRSGHGASHHHGNSYSHPVCELRCKGSLVGHQGPIWCLLVLGNLVFTGSADKTIKVWDIENQYRCIRTLEAHLEAVLSLAGCDSNLYSGSADRSIRLWSCRKAGGTSRNLSNDSNGTTSPLPHPQSPANLPRSPGMTHSSPSMTTGRHGSVGKLDTQIFSLEHTWEDHGEQVCALEVAGGRLFSGSNRVVKVFDVASKEFLQDLKAFKSWVRSMKAAGNQLICASSNCISIWDISTLHLHHQFEALSSGSIYCVEISLMHLYCGSSDSRIHVFDRRGFHNVASLSGHAAVIHDLAVAKTATGYRLVSASFDGTLRVWNLDRSLNCVQVLKKHSDRVTSVTAANQSLYSGGVDTSIKVWQHA